MAQQANKGGINNEQTRFFFHLDSKRAQRQTTARPLRHALCARHDTCFYILGFEHVRWWTFLSTVVIGLAKELYDRFINRERFDCYDWLATTLCGLAVAILAI